MKTGKILILLAFLAFVSNTLPAQYFGQNKPTYETFDFEVVQTPNFEIYHYLKNETLKKALINYTEQWYLMHQNVLKDTFSTKNPIIFYNDHADFQQTNAIGGTIGVGTGGVTEGLRNRVIMPLAMSNQQTFHVLGHELVHAFQYNMIIKGDSTSLKNLANLPLWMVEGLAEYMSIGRVDANTAMWMRDAVINKDVPSIKQLNNPKYFPYRYGQAFWAFLAGWKGDDVIEPFFTAVAKYGFDSATRSVLGVNQKTLSELWVNAIKNHFSSYVSTFKEDPHGKKLIHQGNSGRLNLAPVISPNGRHVIFLSERSVFSTDLFLADATNGKVIRKVASAAKNGHIDDFNYIESAGTWSPDSKSFAFVAVSKGRNVLIIKDVQNGKTLQEIAVQGLPAFSNPSWSPDGRTIVVTGLTNGQIDLFGVNVKSGEVDQITNDPYSEMHPHWLSDGERLVFATDQISFENGRTNGKWVFNLAILDVANGESELLDIFPGADNLNPIEDHNGNILFLSNRDGYRNLYKYDPVANKVYQMTTLLTGISGITPYSPAISLSKRTGRVLYNHYFKNSYDIYKAKEEAFIFVEVDPNDVDMSAATLPRLEQEKADIVDAQIQRLDTVDPAARMAKNGRTVNILNKDYKPKFQLTYVGGGAGVGVGTSNNFGTSTGLVGGVDLLFSDILGDNQLISSFSLNGEITDFGGAIGFINKKGRINWGGSLSHTPSRRVSAAFIGPDNFEIDGEQFLANRIDFQNFRIFQDQASVFAQLPFSKTLRIEAGISFSRYSSRIDLDKNYYDDFGRLIYRDREKLDAPPGFSLLNASAAVVGDNSKFGLTAPLNGYRYRLGVERYGGEFDFNAITADLRFYKFFRPYGIAFRANHYGRYGGNGDELFPLYIGNPWYIRGYDFNSIQENFVQNGKSTNLLFGSKLFVTNAEIRIPFTGPEQLALFKSKFLFTDLNFFADGGVAWTSFDQFKKNNETGLPDAEFLLSVGASVRVNLFGAMVLEPYYALPLQKNASGVFGLNILPGW